MSSEISRIDLRGAVPRGIGAQGIELSETVRRMEESVPQVIILLEAAVERCMNFTGGSEADELIITLDEIMLQYISMLQETLKSLRSVCGIDSSGQGDSGQRKDGPDKRDAVKIVDMVSEEEEWSIVQAALQILTVSDCLSTRSSVFEASLRSTLARLSTSFSLSVFGSNLDRLHQTSNDESVDTSVAARAALDASILRLVDLPEKVKKLLNLLEQVLPRPLNLFLSLIYSCYGTQRCSIFLSCRRTILPSAADLFCYFLPTCFLAVEGSALPRASSGVTESGCICGHSQRACV